MKIKCYFFKKQVHVFVVQRKLLLLTELHREKIEEQEAQRTISYEDNVLFLKKKEVCVFVVQNLLLLTELHREKIEESVWCKYSYCHHLLIKQVDKHEQQQQKDVIE